jgi:hypothetical protein
MLLWLQINAQPSMMFLAVVVHQGGGCSWAHTLSRCGLMLLLARVIGGRQLKT